MKVLIHIGCGGKIQRGYRHGKREFCSKCKTDRIDMTENEILEVDEEE